MAVLSGWALRPSLLPFLSSFLTIPLMLIACDGGGSAGPTPETDGGTRDGDASVHPDGGDGGDPGACKPGDLDPTFGHEGLAGSLFSSRAMGMAVAIDPTTGNIVAAGGSSAGSRPDGPDEFTVVRLLPNGDVDEGFGVDGVARIQASPNQAFFNDVAIQPDGKIVAAGTRWEDSGSGHTCVVARFLNNGQPDDTFGEAGVVEVRDDTCVAQALAIAPDGGVLVSGVAGTVSDFAVFRLGENGIFDDAFGDAGWAYVSQGDTVGIVYDLAVQADGAFFASGVSFSGTDPRSAVARFGANGALDLSFGTDGVAVDTFHGQANGLAFGTGWTLYVAGSAREAGDVNKMVLARLTSAGASDPSFGTRGQSVVAYDGSPDSTANKVVVQGDGKIVSVGQAFGQEGRIYRGRVAISRFLPTGALDGTFGKEGSAFIGTATEPMMGNAIALQPDGRLVVVGQRPASAGDGTWDFLIARVCP